MLPCPAGAQCEASTQLWPDESTRCLCSEGQLSCSPAPSSGMCAVHSHTDCSTFDGAHFRFMDQCSYTLTKTCSVSEGSPQFSVGMVNGQSDNSSLPNVERVNVKINDFRMSFLRRQTERVVVNGVWRTLPLTLARGTVTVSSNPAAVVLKSGFGLFVSFDYTGALYVTLPSSYSDKVCGLCGNFNHNRRDDLQRPDGSDAPNATDLVDSWQTGGNASACEAILVPHYCDPLEETEYASEAYCGALVSHTGPFAECQEALGAESYFRDCVYGMCASHGDTAVLCDTLQVYADLCKKAGVDVPMWRNSSFCSLQCGENSHYNACAEGCPEACSPLDQASSCGSCEERCECDPGFKLSGGQCVQEENCGCWYVGQHYEQGETIIEGECVQECVCIGKGNNNIECRPTQCAAGEACSVRDGVKGCFPFSPATCSVYGDPHYITYDGFAYDFHGGCSYVLTTTCGGKSSVEFTVTGHNMHPPFNNFTQSKLEAVTLEEHTHQVQLPYSTSGRYGQLNAYVDSGYTVLETTFGLRIMIDGQSRLFLQVNEHYKYELCGLCGTYSNRQDDDFVMPGGDNATSAFQFGESWRVQYSNHCVSHPNDPRECNSEEQAQAYDQCYALLEDDFRLCHEAIHPEIYITSCVHDYCATNGSHITLCESLKSYAAACAVAGVELGQWQDGFQVPLPQPKQAQAMTTPVGVFCNFGCSFDRNLCNWNQMMTDAFDWSWHSGSTPSLMTGPSADHSGGGHYLYIEASSVTYGDTARLISSECPHSGAQCLQFWYHMYGSADTMGLHVYVVEGSKARSVWRQRNDQGNMWHLALVDLTTAEPYQIIFEGRRGSNDQSDVAIDDVSLHFGPCSEKLQLSTYSSLTITYIFFNSAVCNLGCSFDINLCNWNQMVTDAFDWTWHSGSTPTLMTGPSADHSGGGHYLYIEASSVTYGDTARLISSECPHSGAQCLQFWYHMYGSADTMGLHVYVVEGSKARSVWSQRNDQGNMWHLAQVDLTTAGAYQIIFEGRRGSTDQSDVAIDDVSLHYGPCSDATEMHTTAGADQTTAATAGPQPPTSPEGQLPTTGNTGVQTRPTEVQTTANPEPPATTEEPLQTTANSGPQATTAARPETGATSERPQPPTDGKPGAPSCPANTHYSSCVSACTPTCSHLYGPPGCSDSDCVAGCVCDDGFVLKRRVCVPIQECGCMDTSGKKYEFGDVWYSSHCREKCKCEKRRGVGRIECEEKDGCDGKAVCLQNNNGDYYCEKTDFSDCTINTDPEYRTFDKKKHEFEGEHSYVLVQTKSLPNNLQHIYIEGINGHDEDEDDDSSEERDSRQARDDDDDDSDENSEEDKEGALRALKIRVYNHTVVLNRVDAPLSPSPGLKIEEHSSRIYLKTDFGLSVEFDRHSEAEIILPHLYKRKVGGLCGNFDGHKSNDFMKPDGTQATGVQEFGESWRV
uniref:Zonadhesin-like n=1 Tax=Neogobius melanostomus TaxID=47308 RepID=A0A8C6U286_9GOBI